MGACPRPRQARWVVSWQSLRRTAKISQGQAAVSSMWVLYFDYNGKKLSLSFFIVNCKSYFTARQNSQIVISSLADRQLKEIFALGRARPGVSQTGKIIRYSYFVI